MTHDQFALLLDKVAAQLGEDHYCLQTPPVVQSRESTLPELDDEYFQKAVEFMASAKKMDDAPIPYMIAAAFKNEAALTAARAQVAERTEDAFEYSRAAKMWREKSEELTAQIAELNQQILLIQANASDNYAAAENRTHAVEAELASLKQQETPEKAWERGWLYAIQCVEASGKEIEGFHVSVNHVPPYAAPAKETTAP